MTKTILLTTCAFATLTFAGSTALAAAASTPSANSNGTTIGELVVTAERRETNLQDTPIAVTAFTSDSLKNSKLEGGEDLLLQIPNSNFARTNFGGYDFKIRGIGTDVIGAGGTAGVSINLNELPISANHFQDTDFYDLERVEVLRGPQGTDYGRNATGGAVDLITAKPTSDFNGYGSIEYGNYNTIKATGAVNIPLGDDFAMRIAGVRLVRDGYGENSYLNQKVDGRDLGDVRVTLSFKPNDRFSAYLLYDHFGEDDTRNRIGKQLCVKDPGPTSVGGVALPTPTGSIAGTGGNYYGAFLSQGCLGGQSLYSNASFGTLNSNSTLGGIVANLAGLNNGTDLFGNHPLQDHNLHDIESAIQPLTTAQEDIIDFHTQWNITDNLTLTTITGYNRNVGSTAEDYNRLVPLTPFTPSSPTGALLFPGGVVNDPQTGKSNLITSFDYGNTESKEYTQEVRLASSFKGPLNFAIGGFYSEETSQPGTTNYYVESNALTAFTIVNNFAYDATYAGYLKAGAPAAVAAAAAAAASPLGGPIHIDPGYPPNGSGHNYYDSRSGGGYLKSYAAFGEIFYDIAPTLKLTLGGRYTVDQLYNTQYPISLLSGTPNGGPTYVDPGFPALGIPGSPTPAVGGFPNNVCTTSTAACIIPEHVTFREFTGNAKIQWTPTFTFTDKTMFYASYSRGYKGGGFNTPCQASLGGAGGSSAACGYPLTYAPEFIDAYEVGTKNTFLGGSLTADLTGFYYNYTGYQVSRIVSESSVNENINAKIYGVEFESRYSPVRNLTLNADIGYIHTSIANGSTSIDSLNLTQGNPAYTLVKTTAGSNCLAPTAAVAGYIAAGYPAAGLSTQCFATAASGGPLNPDGTALRDGVSQNLGGNQLPNTPPVTVSLGAQYVFELPADWHATLRGDYYWQDNSFARIYNAENDRLQSYHIVNATLTFANVTEGLDLQLFVKNAFNAQPIVGTYVTDPTSGLYTNVFTLDPRTFGAQITKRF